MKGNKRTLLPKPIASTSIGTHPTRYTLTRRQPMVAVACQRCRQRKQRCNGARPACRACLESCTECIYDVEEGEKSRYESLRKRNRILEEDNERLRKRVATATEDSNPAITEPSQSKLTTLQSRNTADMIDLGSIVEMFWLLKTSSPQDANRLLNQIRSDTEPPLPLNSTTRLSNTMEQLIEGGKDGEQQEPSHILGHNMDWENVDLPITQVGHYKSDLWKGIFTERVSASPPGLDHFQYDVSYAIRHALPKLASLKQVIQAILNSTGTLFHIFTPDQWEQLFQDVYSEDHVMIPKKTLCEVCCLVAIGSQYCREIIKPEFGEHCYASAKIFLDDVIDEDYLRAIKSCTLLAIYNTVNNGTLAFAYIELGLSLARIGGLFEKQRPSTFDAVHLVDYKRNWRTLIFCQTWISSTLGYSQTNTNIDLQILEMNIENTESFEDTIQARIAHLTTIKADASFRMFKNATYPRTITEKFKSKLHEWYRALPSSMHLSNLTNPQMEPEQRQVMYFMHLFHLNALVLIHRCSLIFLPNIVEDHFVSNAAIQSVEDNFNAAMQSIRILELLRKGRSLFKRCWICIFSAYSSCLILLHGLACKLLRNDTNPSCTEYLHYAGQALSILSLSADLDMLACKFHDTLRGYFDFLSQMKEEKAQNSPRPSCSCDKAQKGTVEDPKCFIKDHDQLKRTIKELLQLACRPFGNRADKAASVDPIGSLMIQESDIPDGFDGIPSPQIETDMNFGSPTVSNFSLYTTDAWQNDIAENVMFSELAENVNSTLESTQNVDGWSWAGTVGPWS